MLCALIGIYSFQPWPSRPSLDMLDRLSEKKLQIDSFAVTTPREHIKFTNKGTVIYLTSVLLKRRPRDISSPASICSLDFVANVNDKPIDFQLWCDRECKYFKLGYYFQSSLGKEVQIPYEIEFFKPMPKEIEVFLERLKTTIEIEFPN